MSKLYIPTSTFNFNNILSSESISPKAFYAERGFGYSRWLSIPENNLDNVVVLYNEAFEFDRPSSDTEDHPMLVEIQTDEEYPSIADGIYYCDHTIYLSPWRTRFIFFNEQDMKVTLSLSESSLETKMLRLYRKGLSVEIYNHKEWGVLSLEHPLNEQAIRQDRSINKMKGLLYGYYIGALLSVTPDVVYKHNALQGLQNIFSAVLSSDERIPTVAQETQIRSIICDMHKELPYVEYLTKQLAEPKKIDEILIQLSKFGVSFPNLISADNIVYALTNSLDEDNKALKWLNKEWNSLYSTAKSQRNLLTPDKEEIIINNGRLVKIAEGLLNQEQEKNLAKAWINETLSSDNYNGKVSSFKKVLADDVTYKAKDIYGEKWSESDAKRVLNDMRRYINGNESDFQWNNPLFSSMAAVIAKGSDWEQLLAFLKSKSICDYRLAFAFFGELNGFANLTRDFTDMLLNEDSKYVASVYKEMYGQLLGVDSTINTLQSLEQIKENNATEDNANRSTTTIEEQSWVQNAKSYICENVQSKKNRDTALQVLNDCALSTVSQFLSKLQSCKGWTKGKTLNGLKDSLNPQNVLFENEQQNETKRNLSMFQDKSWWDDTANMITDSKARKQYLSDLEWFIENHNEFYNDKKKGVVKGYYYGHPTDNIRLLERFKSYLQNKLKPNIKASWVATEYAKVPIDEILAYIGTIYNDNR